MTSYPVPAVERAMKVQEVMLRAMSAQIGDSHSILAVGIRWLSPNSADAKHLA